jgi:ribosomal protein S12 methylthiotransferase
MVGFPGETDKEFEELLNFVKDFRFERLGTFVFSREEGIPAYDFPQQIPMRIKKARIKELMLTQQSISKEINSAYMGKEIEVLVDEIQSDKPKIAIGRTKGDAPEIDGKVIIRGDKTQVGKFVKVKVEEALEYDLVGEVIKL